jgi:hypothetical protein
MPHNTMTQLNCGPEEREIINSILSALIQKIPILCRSPHSSTAPLDNHSRL